MKHDHLRYARDAWRFHGKKRPAEIPPPGPGQESVWDYPRPPVIADDTRLIQVRLGGTLIAETRAAKRVLETASPPTFYLPPESVFTDRLQPATGHSFCEWKGRASYFDVCVNDYCVRHAAWTYTQPLDAFKAIRDYVAFYPDRLECLVDGERARAQAGGFYAGWITDEIIGPFKGEPGTAGW